MTRQEANKQILNILGDYPPQELLEKIDFNGDSEDFALQRSSIAMNVEGLSQFRFIQILWLMGLNANNPHDRFYEESVETLQLLTT